MKKILCLLSLTVVLGVSSPAHALFVNGGFESGDFTGWTLERGNVYYSDTAHPQWGVNPSPGYYGGATSTSAVIGSGVLQPGQTLVVNPYNDSKMARINDIEGNYHATRLSQTATLASDDIGDTLYVNWGAMLVNPYGHPDSAQPYFAISVLKNGSVVDSFAANGNQASLPGSGWVKAGAQYLGSSEYLYYKAGQYTYDLGSGWSVGDDITISMFVADCGYGGHGGFAFLDGIGTDYVAPPNTVPEPSSMLLLGAGLLAAGAARKKFSK